MFRGIIVDIMCFKVEPGKVFMLLIVDLGAGDCRVSCIVGLASTGLLRAGLDIESYFYLVAHAYSFRAAFHDLIVNPSHMFLQMSPLGKSSCTALTLIRAFSLNNMLRVDVVCQLYFGASGPVGTLGTLMDHSLGALIISVVLCACACHA